MTALIVLMALAVLLLVIVALCAAGTVRVHSGIGIRIPATRLSEEAWRAGHRAAFLPALVGAAPGLGLGGFAVAEPAFTGVASVLVMLLLLATLVWATGRAHRAAMSTVRAR